VPHPSRSEGWEDNTHKQLKIKIAEGVNRAGDSESRTHTPHLAGKAL